MLFTPLTRDEETGKYTLGSFSDIECLAQKHNNQLYESEKQQSRKLIIDKGYIFIEGYKNDTVSIIKSIMNMSKDGFLNYSNTVRHYGGLYGINNINHFMQENNGNKEIMKGIQRYKVGDPILFNDTSDTFFNNENCVVPLIHNNMKGRIVDFRFLNKDQVNESIQFDIELDKPLLRLDTDNMNFELIGTTSEGNSIIQFEVYKNKSTDEDDDNVSKSIVPFQVSYAVGIQ